MMRSLLGIILSAFIVNFAWTASQTPNQLVEPVAARVVKDGTEIRENFQNLLKSIANNEAKESGRYRHILKQEIERGREAFDILGEELMVARSPSANRKRDSSKNENTPENITVRKREADDDDDEENTESILDKGITRRVCDNDLSKVIFEAVKQNNESTVKHLIEEKGVPVTVLSELDETIAHVSAHYGHLNLLQYVVDKEPSILAEIDTHGETPLLRAIRGGHLDMVKYLVETRGIDFNQPHTHCFGYSAIHMAAEEGQLAIMKYFVEEKGGDVNVEDATQQTPVFMAAQSGHKHIITYLVEERNADLTRVDYRRCNILFIAVTSNDLELFKYVLDNRKVQFDINWKDVDGLTVVHYATRLDRVEIVKYLVGEKHADVNIPDNFGKTPLHCAARWAYMDVCKYLIENGANTQAKDEQNMLPIDEASEPEVIDYMKEAAAAAQQRFRRMKLRRRVTPCIWDGIFKNNRTITYEGIISLFRARAGYVIDVRRKEEIEQTGSIPSSLNIPLNDLSDALNMSYKDYVAHYNRDKAGFHASVIFTCRSGRRSGEAVRIALAMGYTNPFNYVGGWLDWEKHVKEEEEAHIVWPWWD